MQDDRTGVARVYGKHPHLHGIDARVIVLRLGRFGLHGGDSLEKRSEHFRTDTARAHKSYQAAVLTWGQTTSHEFRIVAYTSMIVLAEKLVFELRRTIGAVAAGDRVEMATEVEVLEDLIEEWRQSARPVATAAVA